MVHGNVGVNVLLPGRPLHLKSFPDQVQRKDACLGQDAGHDSGGGITRAEGEIGLGQRRAERLVRCEEEAHVWHHLGEGRRVAAEETGRTFMGSDVPDGGNQGGIDPPIALCGETRAEQVEWEGRRGGNATRSRAGDEGLRGWRKTPRETREELCGATVGDELDTTVADVEELSGEVTLPQGLSFNPSNIHPSIGTNHPNNALPSPLSLNCSPLHFSQCSHSSSLRIEIETYRPAFFADNGPYRWDCSLIDWTCA